MSLNEALRGGLVREVEDDWWLVDDARRRGVGFWVVHLLMDLRSFRVVGRFATVIKRMALSCQALKVVGTGTIVLIRSLTL